MNCWYCKTELTWCADHDIRNEDDTYVVVTNLSCPNCECLVDVYLPKKKKQQGE